MLTVMVMGSVGVVVIVVVCMYWIDSHIQLD